MMLGLMKENVMRESTNTRCVMRGLDPRIHHTSRRVFRGGWMRGSSPRMTRERMDCRVKPGNDGDRGDTNDGRGIRRYHAGAIGDVITMLRCLSIVLALLGLPIAS